MTRFLHGLHKWTGLISGCNILVLSVTGAYLVFHEDLNRAFTSAVGDVVAEVDPASSAPMQDALDALLLQTPGAMAARARYVPNEPEQVELDLRTENGMVRYVLDRHSGAVHTHNDSAMVRFNDFIFKLHATLFLGVWGSFVLGAVALLLLSSTVSGLIIYTPFMKQMAYGWIRRGRGWRKGAADLHKLVGVSALGFNLLMALTGTALTLGLVGVQWWSLKEIQSRTAGAPSASGVVAPPIDAVWAAAATVHPEAPINNVAYPGGYQGKNYYLVFHDGPGALSRYIPALSLVPVADTGAAEPLSMPWWVQAIMVCFPLHFGNFAGWELKVVYSALGISSGLLTITGALLTFTRYRNRYRARKKKSAIHETVRGLESLESDA